VQDRELFLAGGTINNSDAFRPLSEEEEEDDDLSSI
jgi:hypothetical protein